MAKPNYSFAKRQREIAKKQKKEEKRLRKAGLQDGTAEGAAAESAAIEDEATPLSLNKPGGDPAP